MIAVVLHCIITPVGILISLLYYFLGLKKASGDCVFSDKLVAQTVMQFFMDGHTTTTSFLKFAFYFLSLNPDVQDIALQEVDDFAELHGGDINRDNVDELKYLEQV